MFPISSYQNGPDTYLLQVKDSGFPARLREYLGVARQHSAEFQVSPLTHFLPAACGMVIHRVKFLLLFLFISGMPKAGL